MKSFSTIFSFAAALISSSLLSAFANAGPAVKGVNTLPKMSNVQPAKPVSAQQGNINGANRAVGSVNKMNAGQSMPSNMNNKSTGNASWGDEPIY